MSFIHDATGSVGSFAGYVIAGSGLAVYYFRFIRKYVPLGRKQIVKLHLLMTLLMALMVLAHIFTTDKSNFFVYFAVVLFAFAALMGLSLRISKVKTKAFKKVILAKVIILLIAAAGLTLGHTLLEKERKEHSALNPPSQGVSVPLQVSESL